MAKLTKLSPRVLLKIEMGEFGALPPGLLGRAHIRAYARAVGLDPEEVVRGLADRLPVAPDPLLAFRARQRERFAEAHPVAAALRDGAEQWQERATELARTAPRRWTSSATPWRTGGAAVVDATILALVAGLMLIGAAWLLGTDVAAVWRAARWPFVLSCALMAILYGTLSRNLGRSTPGVVIVAWLERVIRQRHGLRIGRWHVWD